MIEVLRRRYPIERTRYTQSIGKLLPHRISQILQELGLKTWINHGQTNGVDLKAYDSEDHLVLVAEILNWSPVCVLSHKRKNNITNNLSRYNCKKLLIYTCFKNESFLEDLRSYRISLLKIGYQILPRHFYEFYLKRNHVESRKVDSRRTKQCIKSKIVEYLRFSSTEVFTPFFEIVG